MRPAPSEAVIGWVDRQEATELYLTAVTVAELLYGVGRLPDGNRKTDLAERIEAMLHEDYEDRVLSFDSTAAAHYADIVVRRERMGRPISMADAEIAGMCRSHDALLATRNITDFEATSLRTINPWDPQ